MEITDITIGTLDSVADLIDLAESLEQDITRPWAKRFAFRGQAREFGTLTPSFRRQFPRDSAGTAAIIERRLIDAFREHYAKLRDRSADMPTAEQIGPNYDLRCLSVMQHYEIPTRLLDWTSDFWTAIYFACASEPAENAELWLYDRSLFDAPTTRDPALTTLLDASSAPPPEPEFLSRRGDSLLVELDPKLTPRMREQAGHHTVSADVFADHAPLLLALVEAAGLEGDVDPPFKRIIINSSCKGKALQFLAEHQGITASTIFPDVVGLGRFLRWQFESLRTMMF